MVCSDQLSPTSYFNVWLLRPMPIQAISGCSTRSVSMTVLLQLLAARAARVLGLAGLALQLSTSVQREKRNAWSTRWRAKIVDDSLTMQSTILITLADQLLPLLVRQVQVLPQLLHMRPSATGHGGKPRKQQGWVCLSSSTGSPALLVHQVQVLPRLLRTFLALCLATRSLRLRGLPVALVVVTHLLHLLLLGGMLPMLQQ